MGGGEREFERFQVDIVEGGKCEGLFFRLINLCRSNPLHRQWISQHFLFYNSIVIEFTMKAGQKTWDAQAQYTTPFHMCYYSLLENGRY